MAPVALLTGASGANDAVAGFFSEDNRRLIAQTGQALCYAVFGLFLCGTGILRDDYINFDVESILFTALSVALLVHVGADFFRKKTLFRTAFYLNAGVIALGMATYQSAHSVFLIAAVLNVVLAAYSEGTRSALELAFFSAALSNFTLAGLRPDLNVSLWGTALIYNTAVLLTAGLSGMLSREMQQLGQSLEEKTTDLRLARNINELMVENMASGLLAISTDGEIVNSNRAAAKIFEVLGLNSRQLNEISPALWDLVRTVEKVHREEIIHRSMKGHQILVEVVISKMRQEGGWIVLLQNVTEIRNLERELKQNEKLAAVGQLAAGIAHEIRNPLASISGSVQLLAGTLDTATPEDKKLLAIIIKEIDRLNDLISEFLDYVRPTVEVTDPVDLHELLSEVLDMARVNDRLPRGISTERRFEGPARIFGHHDKLKQAFLNVVINAYQAMEKSAEKNLRISCVAMEDSVRVDIEDSGPGIPRDHLHRIFEPFHTTKPKGTGLGLAITYKIFESHGARVAVASEAGHGARFSILFPMNKGLKSST